MQLACVVAIDMTWPFRGDADPIEDPEEAASFDQREKTAIERDAEDLVRIIELTGMGQPEGRAEIAVRSAVETLIKADDEFLEHPPQDAIEAALCKAAVIGKPILSLRLRSRERSNREACAAW